MHPTSNTNEKPTVTLAQPTKQLFQCALDANETISEQDAASALIELLQRDSESTNESLRSLLEKCPRDRFISYLLKHFETDAFAAIKLIEILLSRISCPDCVHRSGISELLPFLQRHSSDLCKDASLFSTFSLLAKVLQASRPLSRNCSQPKSLLHYGQIALNCLQTKSLPSALEKLTPILEFVVAMSYFLGQSLRWTRTLACNCPSGEMRASEGDCHDRPPDSQLPLRLLMVTAMIELRLRLLTAMSTTEQPLGDIEPILTSCFKLILLGISELAVLTSEDKEELVDAMSDDAVSELFLQLLDFSDLLLESLVSWNSTDSMDSCNQDISNTALGCLATFLRWTVFYMTNHFLSVVDDAAAFDETFFKPENPSSAEYMALANRFKNKFWLPVLPVIQRVIPLAFRFSAESICKDNRDQMRVEFLTVCRLSICSLARMFPRVLLSTIKFGTVDFVNCLSLDLSSPHLHSTSSCEESLSSQKRLFELTDGICDLTLLLDTGLLSAESVEKTMSQVDQLVAASSENSGQPVPLKDACIPLLGCLFFELLDAKKQSVLDAVLSSQPSPGTASEFEVCPSCREYDRVLYCRTVLAALAVLRFLTANIWQAEMCILLHVASSSIENPKIPDNPMQLLEEFALKLAQLDLNALQLVVRLPADLADYSLPSPTSSPFTTPLTLRTSAQALLRCCQRTCKGNAPFRRTWKAGLTERQPNTRALFK